MNNLVLNFITIFMLKM